MTYLTATIAALCVFWAFASSVDIYLTQNSDGTIVPRQYDSSHND